MARWKIRKTTTYRSHPWCLQYSPPERAGIGGGQHFRTWREAIGWLVVTRQL